MLHPSLEQFHDVQFDSQSAFDEKLPFPDFKCIHSSVLHTHGLHDELQSPLLSNSPNFVFVIHPVSHPQNKHAFSH